MKMTLSELASSSSRAGALPAKTTASRRLRQQPSVAPLDQLERIIPGLLGSPSIPCITFVYQDDVTRTWAKEVFDRVQSLAGKTGVRATWWKISNLEAPGVLAGAVSTAVRADVIVVATRAEGMPLPFYVWANSWWPHRHEKPGTLVTLVGSASTKSSGTGRVTQYLRAVAQQARMILISVHKPVHVNGEATLHPSEPHRVNGSAHSNGTGNGVIRLHD